MVRKNKKEQEISERDKATISVYLDNGVVYEYEVHSFNEVVREHHNAIAVGGYRHCTENGLMETFPVHRIVKVKTEHPCLNTKYPDRIRGT